VRFSRQMSVRMAPTLEGWERGVRVGILLAGHWTRTLDVWLGARWLVIYGEERMWPTGWADCRHKFSIFYLICGTLSL
jgi:hypothetical protein